MKYAVYHIDSGNEISYHESVAECLQAIDAYNEMDGSFGLLEYDWKFIEED